MSPSGPPMRISEPSASRYAFVTHCCAGSPPPRSRSIAGSATFTIVPSIMATPDPRMAAASVMRWTRLIRARRLRGLRERDRAQHAGAGAEGGWRDRARDLARAEPRDVAVHERRHLCADE